MANCMSACANQTLAASGQNAGNFMETLVATGTAGDGVEESTSRTPSAPRSKAILSMLHTIYYSLALDKKKKFVTWIK